MRRSLSCVVLGTAYYFLASELCAAQQYKAVKLYALVNPNPNASMGLETITGGVIASHGQVIASHATEGALLFDPPDGAVTFFGPHHFFGTNGSQQVGQIGELGQADAHAALWSGTAGSVVDLHPTHWSGVRGSRAYGVAGGQQVGRVTSSSGRDDAVLWNGSSASAIDLNPTNLGSVVQGSTAFATDGVSQVGVVGTWDGVNSSNHAVLWSGSATSAVDLNPTLVVDEMIWLYSSEAYGVFGNSQVGRVSARGIVQWTHAALWHGTADSLIDLHPSHFAEIEISQAVGTNGSMQVGFGVIGLWYQALLWSGSSLSAVNLHDLLPDQYIQSYAYSIDAAGNVYGVGEFYEEDQGVLEWHAVKWTPVPEPGTAMLAICGVMCLYIRGRARRR